MNYYDLLGVKREATSQEIKSAFRRLAMEHHPDRGGSEAHFQKINQAYDTLSDPDKRSRYDSEINFRTGSNTRSFEDATDIFNQMFRNPFEFGRGRSGHGRTRAKNLDLNIKCKITLLDSYMGKEIEASYKLPSGRKETVVINIPAGVEDGDTIKFAGMGDDTYPQVNRGDLNVTVHVAEDLNFTRRGDNITTIIEINAIEAMIGCTKPIETIDGRIMNIKLKPGMTHGGEYSASGLGFRNIRTDNVGNFVVVVYIKIPAITDDKIKKKLEELKDEIDNLPK